MASLEKAKAIVKQGNCRGLSCTETLNANPEKICPIHEAMVNNWLPVSYCHENITQIEKLSDDVLDYLREYIAKEGKMEWKKEEFVAGKRVRVSDTIENPKSGLKKIYLFTLEDAHWCCDGSALIKLRREALSNIPTEISLTSWKYLAKDLSSQQPKDVGIKEVMSILEEKFGSPVRIVKED